MGLKGKVGGGTGRVEGVAGTHQRFTTGQRVNTRCWRVPAKIWGGRVREGWREEWWGALPVDGYPPNFVKF